MQNMNMEVNDVRFTGDTADAQVRFVSTESPQAFVVIRYQLRKEGGKWQVQSTSRMEMGGNPHGQTSGAGSVPNPHGGSPVEGPMGPVPQP
jgi:hypothetical protein